MPILTWLPQYNLKLWWPDLIAGLTLAAFVFPESLAYAGLAGVPPEFGIYCIITSGIFFALFTSSKQVVIGPTSAISLMVGTTVAVLSGGDPARWAAIASLTALVVAVLCIIAYILRLSAMVDFISENILLGFKAGAALTIMSSQLPKLLGIEGGGGNFFERIANIAQHLPDTNLKVFGFGLTAFLLLVAGHRLFPGRPVSLIVVIGSILIFSFTDWANFGFHLTGEIPAGPPPLGRPSLRFKDVDGILGLALGCFLMGYIETIAVAKTFAAKHNYAINPRQELLSLGLANFGSAFASGLPVSGGLSQSTVNDKGGAKTPMTLIICSVLLLLLLLYFTPALKNLPEVILAAIVFDAVLGLIKVKALKEIYYLNRSEFAISMITVLGVLTFGILKGILISAIISILLLIIKSKNANIALLGQIPGTKLFSDINRNPDNIELEHIKILRIESSLLYYNEENNYQLLESLITGGHQPLQLVILDLSSTPFVDIAGTKMLVKFIHQLQSKNVQVKIVGALGNVRDMLRKLGAEEQIGHISRRDSIEEEIRKFQTARN